MPEVQFNPDTGSGEFVGRNNNFEAEQQSEVSAQELSDGAQSRAFRNTAENLTQRAYEKEGVGAAQVGAGDVDLEIRLQETQQELFQLQNGTLPHNPLKMLQLEALQNRLASELVSGESTPSVAPPELNEEWDPKADLEAGLASDPAVQETLSWSADTFSQEVNETFNEMLAAPQKAETTQRMVQELKNLKANPDSFTTAEEMNEISQQTIDWFSTEYSPDIAKQVKTISAAVRNGVATKRDAMALVVKSPGLMQAFLRAAHDPEVDFTLGL